MTRVIVHAGFHKTGTTSLQDFLARNRAALAPWLGYAGPGMLKAASRAARGYARRPAAWRRWRFRRRLAACLREVEPAPVVVLSLESFSGVMPGHRRFAGRPVRDYATAAVPLGREIVAALRRRFGPAARIEFVYTTRARAPWLASVHAHLLRSIRLVEDRDAFAATIGPLPPLAVEARRIAAGIGVAAHVAPLERHGPRREGPAGAILDIVGVPEAARAGLTPAERLKPADPPDLSAAYLELNRAGGTRARLRARKARLGARRDAGQTA